MLSKVKVSWKKVALAVLALLVGLSAGAVGGWLVADHVRVEHEYYRGMYDACLWFTARYLVGVPDATGCNSWVDSAVGSGWYGDPSPGFDGPSPTGGQQSPSTGDTAILLHRWGLLWLVKGYGGE